MKSYSFIRETVPIVMQTKPKEGNSALSITTSIASSASMTDVLLKSLAVVAGEVTSLLLVSKHPRQHRIYSIYLGNSTTNSHVHNA